jgi:hypothetical protein
MIKQWPALLFLVILTGASCKHKGDHLPPEELAPILADLHLADAYSGMLHDASHPTAGKNYDSLALWTKSILAKYHVTQEEFTKSMDWYRDRPIELDSLYAKVIPILNHNKK